MPVTAAAPEFLHTTREDDDGAGPKPDGGKLRRLLEDCRAIAAHDDAVGVQSLLGKYIGEAPAAPLPCSQCWHERTCDRCRERAREHEQRVTEGHRLRQKLDRIAQRGALARKLQGDRRKLDQRWLDLFYTLAVVALVAEGHELLEEHQRRALTLAWALGCPAAAPVPPAPRPVLEHPGVHPLERGASVVEWLVRNHARRDHTEAVAVAFVDDQQRTAWKPAPPAKKSRTDSDETRARLDAAWERYSAALANAGTERTAHGRSLLRLAIAAWFGDPMDDGEHST